MTSLKLFDGVGDIKYLQMTGSGTEADPFVANLVSPTYTWLFASGTLLFSGDGTVLANAGSTLYVKEFMWQNEGTADATSIVKFGTVEKWRAKLPYSTAGAITFGFAAGEEWNVGTVPLVVNLSGSVTHGYSLRYRWASA